MKKIIFLFFILSFANIYSQYDISAGMGLNFFSTPDLKDYINANYSTSDNLQSFNTSADFFGEFGLLLNDEYQISLEYTYNLFSFNSSGIGGIYDLNIVQHKPSILGYILMTGSGYKFKFGTGIGYRVANLEEKIPGLTELTDYSKTGLGIILKAQGDTKLGGNFYALIAGEIRYELLGDIKFSDNNIVSLNTFGVGLKLGVSYYF